jgi:glutathione peroxidase
MTGSIYDISVTRADGGKATLSDYSGKVMLIVNVASKCGFTRQYDGLEALNRTFHDQGLAVLGFPANDFGQQEPGSDAEIQDFCRLTYGVDFPVFAKIEVTGPHKHPLYAMLTGEQPKATFKPGSKMLGHLTQNGKTAQPTEIGWNFEKFLVDKSGSVVARYGSDTEPEDEELVAEIRRLLEA